MLINDAIMRRELLGMFRSKKAFVCQFVFVALLSAVVYVAWPKEAHMVTAQAYIARRLFSIFALAQLALVCVLAPIPAAGAVAAEKERQTLDLLLSAPIPAKHIVIGKLLSSVLLLVLLLLSGLPVLSQCYRLGGVSPLEVVWLYLTLAAVAIAFAGVGITCSVFCQRTHSAIAISYLVVVPLAAVLLIVVGKAGMRFNAVFTAILVLNSLGLTAILLQQSCDRLGRGEFWRPPQPAGEEDPSLQQGLSLAPSRFPDMLLLPPRRVGFMPDGRNPIFDRETRYEIFGAGTLATRAIILGSFAIAMCMIGYWFQSQHVYIGYLMIFSAALAAASSSRCLTHEKERGTLALLGATPLSSRQVVMGKLMSVWRYVGVLAAFLLVPWVASSLAAGIVGVPRHLGLACAFLPFLFVAIASASAIGTFFSLLLPTTGASMVATYLTLILLYAGPVAASDVLAKFTHVAHDKLECVSFISPFAAIASIGRAMPSVSGGSGGDALSRYWFAPLGLHAALALVLIGLSIAGFERFYRRAADKT